MSQRSGRGNGGRGGNNNTNNSTPKSTKSKKKGKGSNAKSELDSNKTGDISTPSPNIDDSSNQGQFPTLNTEHRQKDKCPCNQSSASWKIDCSKCHQYWHIDCLNMTGLSEAAINSMSRYLCPFCFVSPVPTIQTSLDICHICRNTLSLQQANRQDEASIAAQKIQNVAKCCKMLEGIDFEEFSGRLDTLSQFDQRLRHLLLSEHSLKGLDSEIKSLTEALTSATPSPECAPSSAAFDSLTCSISKLQHEIQLLSCKPVPTAPTSSAFESSEQLLKTITQQLDELRANEPKVAAGISDLQQSILKLQPTQCLDYDVSSPAVFCPPDTTPSSSELHTPHGQLAVSDMITNFVQPQEADDLTSFFSSCQFKPENGHSVISFGVPYEYTGSKSSSNVPPIPNQLGPLFEKINEIQTKLFRANYPQQSHLTPPVVNSCLVNKYDGPESYLPQHSDKEVTIHPESSVFTLSLGETCDLKFIERESGTEQTVTCSDRMLYHMNRRSQEVFEHLIEKGSVSSGVRYV